jgi:tRNA threonylcarbamoyladenosine biosynthesis protein TsaB
VSHQTPLLFAIDTSGDQAGVALAGDGRIDVALLATGDRGNARTEDLAAETAALFASRGRSILDVTAIAAVVGPGSYTGLRSGLAFLRGLAFGDTIPAISVGTLELLAWRSARQGETVIAAAPAASGRHVVATYMRGRHDVEERTPPQILETPDIADFLLASRGAGTDAIVFAQAGGSSGSGRSASSDTARAALESAARAAGLERRTPASNALEQLAMLAESRASRAPAPPQILSVAALLPLYVGQSSARPNRHRVAVPGAAE